MFKNWVEKNPIFNRKGEEAVRDIKALNHEISLRRCDHEKLAQTLKSMKNSKIDSVRGTGAAKACEDFKL